MNPRLSFLIGTVVALALSLALLVPSADRRTLIAQGVNSLLKSDLDAWTAEAGNESPPGTAEAASLFQVLDRLSRQIASPSVALELRLDGTEVEDERLRRAFGTNLNLFNDARRRADPKPGAEAPPQVALAAPRESAPSRSCSRSRRAARRCACDGS